LIKREARILLASCNKGFCIAVVLRGMGVDGVIVSENGCRDICLKARMKGYMGELRFFEGECDCGLMEYPGIHEGYLLFLERLLNRIKEFLID